MSYPIRKIINLSLLWVLIVSAHARATNHEQGDTLYFRGYVCDAMRRPLSGVTVDVIDMNRETKSEANGRYIVGPLSYGEYSIIVKSKGYRSIIEKDIILSRSNQFYQHNYIMSPGTDSIPVTRLIPYRGAILGHVIGKANKQPIPEAFVTIMGTMDRVGTHADGSFKLIKVPVGKYSVLIEKDGYLSIILKRICVRRNDSTLLHVELDIDPDTTEFR